MSEMIERVARAVGNDLYGYVDPDDTPNTWRMSLATARAAIEAMLKPSEGMLIVGAAMCDEDDVEQDRERAKGVYTMMLSAALSPNTAEEK